jgi:hypothetical protein
MKKGLFTTLVVSLATFIAVGCGGGGSTDADKTTLALAKLTESNAKKAVLSSVDHRRLSKTIKDLFKILKYDEWESGSGNCDNGGTYSIEMGEGKDIGTFTKCKHDSILLDGTVTFEENKTTFENLTYNEENYLDSSFEKMIITEVRASASAEESEERVTVTAKITQASIKFYNDDKRYSYSYKDFIMNVSDRDGYSFAGYVQNATCMGTKWLKVKTKENKYIKFEGCPTDFEINIEGKDGSKVKFEATEDALKIYVNGKEKFSEDGEDCGAMFGDVCQEDDDSDGPKKARR